MPSFPIEWAGAFFADASALPTTFYVITDQYFWSVGPAKYATVTDNGDATVDVSASLVFPDKCTVRNSVFNSTRWPSGVFGISIQPSNGTYQIVPPSQDTVCVDTDHSDAGWRAQFEAYNGNNWASFLGWSDFGSNLHNYIFASGLQVNFAQSGAILPAGNLNIWNAYTTANNMLTNRISTGLSSDRGYWEITVNVTVSGRVELIPPPPPTFTLDHIEFTDSETAIVHYTYNSTPGEVVYKLGGGVWWPLDNSLFGIMKIDSRYRYIHANNEIYNVHMNSQHLGVFDARS